MDPSCLYVDMHIDFFANFMFKENINDAFIELTLPEISSNKDMFFFLVDLLCKGLVILFGIENRVELEHITLEQFEIIKKKMGLAGINVNLNVIPLENPILPLLNLREIEDNEPENLPLQNYIFKINNINMQYSVSFELFHRIL
jgi:hypothetical protein